MRSLFLACLSVLVCLCFLSISYQNEIFAADSFVWTDNEEKQEIDLKYGDATVLRYMYAYDTSSDKRAHETYKVFHHAFSPSGSDLQITKGPHGKYTHHRGLYVGWSKTRVGDQTYDFWHCKAGAHLRHAKVLMQTASSRQATMTTEIHWNDAEGKPVIREERTVMVQPIQLSNGLTWQIDWSTRLFSERGDIVLEGDRQHAGFQYRAAQQVAEESSAKYVRPEGFPQQADAYQVDDSGNPPRHIDLNWFAMSYPVGGEQISVEYFEAPGQPKPALYSERPYGRFGTYYKTELSTDKPLSMKYRLVISEGMTPTRDEIQQRYDAYLHSLK